MEIATPVAFAKAPVRLQMQLPQRQAVACSVPRAVCRRLADLRLFDSDHLATAERWLAVRARRRPTDPAATDIFTKAQAALRAQ